MYPAQLLPNFGTWAQEGIRKTLRQWAIPWSEFQGKPTKEEVAETVAPGRSLGPQFRPTNLGPIAEVQGLTRLQQWPRAGLNFWEIYQVCSSYFLGKDVDISSIYWHPDRP